MGISVSRYTDLTSNEYLEKFCSSESISSNDPFWNKLLAFNIKLPKNAEEQLMLDASVEALLQKFLANNTETGNLGALVQVFITRATELLASPSTDNAMLSWQTFNALFVIRSVAKYLIETVPEHQLCQHFDVHVDRRSFRNGNHINNAERSSNPIDQNPTENLANPSNSSISDTDAGKLSNAISEAEGSTQDEVTHPRVNGDSAQNDRLGPNDRLGQDEGVRQNDVSVGHGEMGQVDPKGDATPKTEKVSPKLNMNESKLEMLIDALVGLIIDVPVTDNTYYLHLECINTIIVLMSVYMFAHVHGQGNRAVESSLIYRALFEGRYSMHAPLLIKTLLHNFSAMAVAPQSMFGYSESGGSLVMGLASGIWSLLTLSGASKPQSVLSAPTDDVTELQSRLTADHPVANQSCLLLLALTNHRIDDANLYRRALFGCEDSEAAPARTSSASSEAGGMRSCVRADMAALHRALCACAASEHATLLLYLMLHSCAAYRRHALAAHEPSALVIPVLQSLYRAPDSNSHHIYMSLIVLLMLTESEHFIKSVHQITIKSPQWYTERAVSEISLGGLMVLVIVRTVQYNILRVRDKYLHTNCLAALANMSCEFRNLHPYVAQRLVSLYETICKRLTLQEERMANYDAVDYETRYEEWEDGLDVLEEVLRMLLEILNSCLTHQLPANTDLVYALLYKRDVFKLHREHPERAAILANIEMVIGFFSSRLQRVQDGLGRDLTVAEVLSTIRKGSEQWSSDRLKKFPELKFRYVEEERPGEFFTPYAWSLVAARGGVRWASECGAKALAELSLC